MVRLNAGDRVDCRVKSNTIVSPYKEYDEVRTFEIVATDNLGYYLYVPHYLFLKGSIKADQYRCRSLGIDKRFLDEQIVYIQENLVSRVSGILDGMSCAICHEFFSMAAPNQDDGTLICHSCRRNPYR